MAWNNTITSKLTNKLVDCKPFWQHIVNIKTLWILWYLFKIFCIFCSLILTHCGLVALYSDINLGQHYWLREWLGAIRHHAITWTNVDISSVGSCTIHLKGIVPERVRKLITTTHLKITLLKSKPYLVLVVILSPRNQWVNGCFQYLQVRNEHAEWQICIYTIR